MTTDDLLSKATAFGPISAKPHSDDGDTIELWDDVGPFASCYAPRAALIVRAVNSFEDMRKALQAMKDLDECNDQADRLAEFDAKHGIKPGQGRHNYIFDAARSALRLAEGGAE